LVDPSNWSPPKLGIEGPDTKVAEEVDDLVDRARDAIAAADGQSADRALAAAEGRLRAHPELPNAAWLMAEVERCRSTRWRRVPPVDAEAADRSWLRAEALDGGRLPGVGEQASAQGPAAATLAVGGEVAPPAQAWLDGSPVGDASVATHQGLHALVVTWAGSPVWAAWIDVPAGASVFAIDLPAAPPCSAAEFRRVRIEGDSVVAEGQVQCPRWVVATEGDRAPAVRVATCGAGQCRSMVSWQAAPPWTALPTAQQDTRGRLPAWATWGLVGVGAAVATGAAVIVATALRPAPTEVRFYSNGLKQQ
jgi:hypothetical protein